MNYHYANQDNQPVGPVSEDELHELYRSGAITAQTNVFREGDSDWKPFQSLALIPPPPPQSLAPIIRAQPVSLVRLDPTPMGASTQKCPFCAEDISIHAKKCKHCGEIIDIVLRAAEEAKRASARPAVYMNAGGASSSAAASNSRPTVVVIGSRKSGLVAAFLNVFIPGLGYMYCGRVLLGLFVFMFTVVLVAATAGIAALILYPIFVIDGFLAAGRANREVITVA